MGKNKKDSMRGVSAGDPIMDEATQNLHNEFAKPPKLLILQKIVEIDAFSESLPSTKTEVFSIRADAIDIVESATYGTKWEFTPAPPRRTIVYFQGMHLYWVQTQSEPCVKIKLADGDEFLIVGDLLEITARVEAGSTD